MKNINLKKLFEFILEELEELEDKIDETCWDNEFDMSNSYDLGYLYGQLEIIGTVTNDDILFDKTMELRDKISDLYSRVELGE